MHRVGFEPVTLALQWAKTLHALDLAAIVIGARYYIGTLSLITKYHYAIIKTKESHTSSDDTSSSVSEESILRAGRSVELHILLRPRCKIPFVFC
jgi:hypothetical protein